MNDIEQAIRDLQFARSEYHLRISGGGKGKYLEPVMEAINLGIQALREKAEHNSPKPLSVEALMRRDGKPVYTVTGIHLPCENDAWWGVARIYPESRIVHFYGVGRVRSVDIEEYGKTWLAYDHEPREEI